MSASLAPSLVRRHWLARAGALLGAATLGGCASPSVDDLADQRPLLDLRAYFNGRLRGHGIVTDRSGAVIQRFTVEMVGRWDGERGTLEEDFLHHDGRRERRVWQLEHLGSGRWRGRAGDVIGEALGRTAGNALHWNYTLRVTTDGGRQWDLQLEDWMFLVDDQVLLNRAVMRKFGLPVGEVLLSMRRLDAGER